MLQRIDVATTTEDVSPAPAPRRDGDFFDNGTSPADFLVAELGGVVAGYVAVGARYPGLTAAEHVQELKALAVDPQLQGRGVGRRLVLAAADRARRRGARRLTLKVLGTNHVARRLYERCGFVVEGVAPEEFRLRGRYVDDMLLGLDLTEPISGSAPRPE
jgi:ribosomal protein S18 acetylase RimI-like enzyme